MLRAFLLGGMLLALSGCGLVAIPPAVTIASYAADGVSFLVSGKSLTDHAISEVADRDCAMWRLIKMENPCLNEDGEAEVLIAHEPGVYEPANGTLAEPSRLWQPPEEGESDEYLSPDKLGPVEPAAGTVEAAAPAEDAAAVEAAASGAADAPGPLPEPKPNVVPAAEAEPGPPPAPVSTVTVEPLPAPDAPLRQKAEASDHVVALNDGGSVEEGAPVQTAALPVDLPDTSLPATRGGRRFVVIGSFADRANAEGLARANPRLGPMVAAARVDGRDVYRVVTETAAPEDAVVMRAWLRRNGFADAWPIAACTDGRRSACLRVAPASADY